MKRIGMTLILLAGSVSLIPTTGCNEDARVARIAIESAQRQAEQSREMARAGGQVSEGAKRLVAADAEARKELTAAHRELQAESAKVGRQRDRLEAERREIASQRRTESILGPVIKSGGVLVVCGLVITFCLLLLFGLRRQDGSADVLSELLVEELASDRPVMLPSRQPRPSLEHEDAEPALDQPSPPSAQP